MVKNAGGSGWDLREISPSNIDSYGVLANRTTFKKIVPAPQDANRAEKQLVKAGDILFAIKGSIGKCALVSQEQEGCLANQSFVIIRLKPSSILKDFALYRFLMAGSTQTEIERISSGATVKNIKMQDLVSLPIPIPSLEQQAELEGKHRKILQKIEEKSRLEREINQAMATFWGDE